MDSRQIRALKETAAKIAAIPVTYLIIGPLVKKDISTFYAFGAWVPSQWIYLIALAIPAAATAIWTHGMMVSEGMKTYQNVFRVVPYIFSVFYLMLFGIHVYAYLDGFNPQVLGLVNAALTIVAVYLGAIYLMGWTVWAVIFRPKDRASTI